MSASTIQTSRTAMPGLSAVRSSAAMRFWIVNGALWFIFSLTVWSLWILGPDFKENAIGRDQAPQAYVLWIRFVEVASIILAIGQIWYFILRPKIRTGRLTFDGLFFLSCWMLYIQEPWINYNAPQFLYTTVSYNRGSWCNYIPGWNSPNAELIPVGSVIWCFAYLTLVGLWAFAGSKVMRWARDRWPGLAGWQLIGICFLAFIPADLILEHLILYTELFNYSTTVPELTLWAGEKYQFPIYEVFSWCATLTSLSAFHFFRNDQGESYGQRGIGTLKIPEGGRTFLRFIAIMGTCQMAFFLTYNVPYFYWSTKGGSFPPYASYRVGGLCGPGTRYDCPGLKVPVPKAASPTNRVIESAPVTRTP